MDKDLFKVYRLFLKDSIRKVVDFSQTDQNRGIKPPPLEKPFAEDAVRVDLPRNVQFGKIGQIDLAAAIGNRESRRAYRRSPLSLDEMSFLLWATQGVKEKLDPGHALRTVPSAGCRHALETYLVILNVSGMEQGVYRYLPLEHQLLLEFTEKNLERKIVRAALDQPYPGEAAVTFVWTAVPIGWNGATDSPPTRSLLLTPVMSARISILPVKPSAQEPVRSAPTTRVEWTSCSGWTAKKNLRSIWLPWAGEIDPMMKTKGHCIEFF
jgi:hypothetical protein